MRDNLDLPIDELSYDDDRHWGEYSWGPPSRTFTKVCKRCSAPNLHWTHTESGWRLATNNGKIHECELAKDSLLKLVLKKKV